jgi:hypothetical protein
MKLPTIGINVTLRFFCECVYLNLMENIGEDKRSKQSLIDTLMDHSVFIVELMQN